MDPPHIKSSYGRQNNVSHRMSIRLGIDYITCKNIQKWIPLTSHLHVDTK